MVATGGADTDEWAQGQAVGQRLDGEVVCDETD